MIQFTFAGRNLGYTEMILQSAIIYATSGKSSFIACLPENRGKLMERIKAISPGIKLEEIEGTPTSSGGIGVKR